MRSLVLNLVMAAVWLQFSSKPSLAVFAIGMIIGFVLLAAFRKLMGSEDYVRRTLAVARFVLVFLREFLAANLSVIRIILFESRQAMQPNFFTLDVAGMKPYEILILSYCITLTPGTTSVEIEDDFKTLVVHALDGKDPEAIRGQINTTLKDAILKFTR